MKKLPLSEIMNFVDALGLSPAERLLFELLLSRRGSFISSHEIQHTIFGLHNAENVPSVSETVHALKAKLSKFSDVELCELQESPSQISYALS